MLFLDRFAPDTALPAQADVVVVGGGIIGVCTALALAERGVSVVLCEKGEIGAEQSGRNWGWVRTMGRDEAEIPLSLASLTMWREADRRYSIDTGFRQTGVSYFCRTESQVQAYAGWQRIAGAYGVEAELLSSGAVAARAPGERWAGGLHCAADGRAEPFRAPQAWAKAAQQAGARIVTRCAVRGVETSGGAISGVVTEAGTIACASVVMAGGAWSRLFLGNVGIDFPQLKILSSVMRTAPIAAPIEGAIGTEHFGIRKRGDGGYTIAERNANLAYLTPDSFRLFADYWPMLIKNWREFTLRLNGDFMAEARQARHWPLDRPTIFETARILDPAPDVGSLRKAMRAVRSAFPIFEQARVVERWAGIIDVTPDAVPVISPVAALPGLVIATGFSGHGFGLGPAAGRLAADLVVHDAPIVDPAPFRLDRFARAA